MAATVLLLGCDPGDVGTLVLEPGFLGDAGQDTGPIHPDPTSGLSECWLLEFDGCGVEQACVPTAAGIRVCVDNAVLPIGVSCTEQQRVCVAGALCYLGTGPARCAQLCDPQDSECLDGRCVDWLDIDGERAGRCVRSDE